MRFLKLNYTLGFRQFKIWQLFWQYFSRAKLPFQQLEAPLKKVMVKHPFSRGRKPEHT